MKSLKPRTLRTVHALTRAGIQLVFFIFFPAAFNSAFTAVKNIFTQLGKGQMLEWSSFTRRDKRKAFICEICDPFCDPYPVLSGCIHINNGMGSLARILYTPRAFFKA